MRTKIELFFISVFLFICSFSTAFSQTAIKDLLSYPYPSNLTSSPATARLAWTFNQNGQRNIYLSTDKGQTFKKLTDYTKDTGQQISGLQFSPDGNWLVYMRGGEPHGNWSSSNPVDPTSSPQKPVFQLWSLNVLTGKKNVLATDPWGSRPAISPDSKRVAFVDGGSVHIVPIDGSEKPQRLFYSRGNSGYLEWSPDGSRLAFVSNRGSYSFIGIYTDEDTPVQWIDPSFARDSHPKWSPDGSSVVFIRRPASGGAPGPILKRHPRPWEIRTADIHEDKSTLLWKSPDTLNGSVPTTNGGYNLHWAANNRIVFLSTEDNWPHLYSIPAKGGDPLLLTPGKFMVEYINLSPDGKQLIFSANTGPDKFDIDRRHIGIVSVDKQNMNILTPGEGLEASPVFIDNKTTAFISSNAYRPALPAVKSVGSSELHLVGKSLLSPVYSSDNLVKPEQVIFKAPDGTPIHGQLFKKGEETAKKPAVLAIHGGPMRQMLLGWSYSDYYAAHYSVNQWLANHGYVVLSVNYRMGIGYGNEFHHPAHAGRHGLSEYQDILAAGKWLAKQPYVDASRIGVYGGSYGGYLTAFALGKNSDLFAAGVDISGVHSRVPSEKYTIPYEHAPDAAMADTVAWQSSPIAYVDTWKSPVLLIHADDDRNVAFNQSINLLNRLNKKGVYTETIVIPDDTHHWLRHHNLIRIYEATIDFLNRKVKNKK